MIYFKGGGCRNVDLVLTAVTPHWSGLERDAQCGRPDDGLRFSQYSLRALVEKENIPVKVPLSLRLELMPTIPTLVSRAM